MSPSKTLLCVDDEPNILLTLNAIFKAAGYNVITATTASDALRQFHANEIDIVLLDRWLAGTDGNEVLALMKGAKPHVPILLCTGEPDLPERKVHSAAALADAVVYKPCHPSELLRLVGRFGSAGVA